MEQQYAKTTEDCTPFAAAKTEFEGICMWLQDPETMEQSHADVERALHEKGLELLRLMLGDHYVLRGMAKPVAAVVGAEGEVRTHQRCETARQVETLFGAVAAPRVAYEGRDLGALHPTDASLNLPVDLYSHEVRRQVSLAVAGSSFEEATEAVERTTAAHVPKRQAEILARAATQDFDDFYGRREWTRGPSSDLLILSFDFKGVVMLSKYLSEATKKRALQRKLQSRHCKGEPHGRKRMSTVAAVYTIGPDVRTAREVVDGLRRIREVTPKKRPKPEQKRVWASLKHEPEAVIEAAFQEAERRDPEHTKRWLVLVDGEESLATLVRKVAKTHGAEITLVLDMIHALQYLWKAGLVLHAEGTPELEDWVLARFEKILEGEVSLVVAGMTRSATRRGLSAAARKPIDRAARYLLKRKAMMPYAELLALGAPTASGVIEGACRHLINDRLDITGARWSLDGAEAVLRLRALKSSGDFDDYWCFHEQAERHRNHDSRYADGHAPRVELPRRIPHLRLIKG